MIMSTTFSERVHELMDYHRLNKNSLSVKLGFTATTTITRLAKLMRLLIYAADR